MNVGSTGFSSPSPRTRDGEELQHEAGRARDSAARRPKCSLCTRCATGAKTGLIGREQRSHEAPEKSASFFLATNKCCGRYVRVHYLGVPQDAVTITFWPAQINPFSTAVPFWGHTTQNLTGLSPRRDCNSKRVKCSLLAGP